MRRKKVNKTKKTTEYTKIARFVSQCFACVHSISRIFLFFRVIFYRVFVFFRIQCNLHGFSVFFICLFHVHFSPDNFHLFRLVFTFFRFVCAFLVCCCFFDYFFSQCCSLCFWIYIFFLCIVCFVFSAFFETYFARA